MVKEMNKTLDKKNVTISSKRQITIPQKFYTKLKFEGEAECIMRENELVLRPIRHGDTEEFADLILADLIEEGYHDKELLDEFRRRQKKIRPAVEKVIEEADQAAHGDAEYYTLDEVFGNEGDV